MNKKTGPYHVVNLTPGRRVWINTLDMSWPRHCIYGLLEADVTLVRQFIAEHKARTDETLSFTGFLVYCLARAVDEDKTVQAYLKGRKQLVLFDDVDVGLMVEHKDGEKRALMGHVIRRQSQDLSGDSRRDSRSPIRTRAAGQRHAHLVPFCHVASVAAVQPVQSSAR